MKCSSQPVYFAPRTHELTVGELLEFLKDKPLTLLVADKDGRPFEVFEQRAEANGAQVCGHKINLPID